MKFIFVFQFLIFFLISCSRTQVIKKPRMAHKRELQSLEDKKIYNVIKPILQVDPYFAHISPGEVYKLKTKAPLLKNGGIFTCKNKELPFIIKKNILIAYISETYFSEKKSFDCFYSFEKSKIKIATFKIKEKKFPFEKLSVDKKKVYYSSRDLARILKEKKELNSIYNSSEKVPLFRVPFKLPLRSRVTSIYGTKRLFNNNKKSQHLGTDYRARIGQPIRCSNTGKVVLSKDLFFSGKTVIVDHGMGIFTLYGHLSKIFSKKGEKIPKSGLIGAAGMTGRVTGPHLHWGVKVNGNWVDGKSLIRQSASN